MGQWSIFRSNIRCVAVAPFLLERHLCRPHQQASIRPTGNRCPTPIATPFHARLRFQLFNGMFEVLLHRVGQGHHPHSTGRRCNSHGQYNLLSEE